MRTERGSRGCPCFIQNPNVKLISIKYDILSITPVGHPTGIIDFFQMSVCRYHASLTNLILCECLSFDITGMRPLFLKCCISATKIHVCKSNVTCFVFSNTQMCPSYNNVLSDNEIQCRDQINNSVLWIFSSN